MLNLGNEVVIYTNFDNPVSVLLKAITTDYSLNAAYISIRNSEDDTLIETYKTSNATLTPSYTTYMTYTFNILRENMASYTVGEKYYGDLKIINNTSDELFICRISFAAELGGTALP